MEICTLTGHAAHPTPTTPLGAPHPRLPRDSSESQGDKSGRATPGEPPQGSSPRETE